MFPGPDFVLVVTLIVALRGLSGRCLGASGSTADARIALTKTWQYDVNTRNALGYIPVKIKMQRPTAPVLYDAMMRLPIMALTGYFLWRETSALQTFLHSRVGAGLDAHAWAAIAGHVAISVFLLLLLSFHLARLRPVKKSQGLLPRFAALAGLTLGYLLLLLPRAEPDVLYQTASATIIGIGGFLCVAVVMQLGRSLSIMPEARRLVTHGFYRHIRHPLYLVEQIVSLGIFLQFRSLEAAVVLLANLAFQFWRMIEEEKVLVAAFPEYENYRRRTARVIPGIY